MRFKHSGKYGDLIFALPTIQAMGGGTLYLPENGPEVKGLYSSMWPLLESLPYIRSVRRYPDVVKYGDCHDSIDVDLDLHRTHPQRGKVNIVQRYFDVFGTSAPIPDKWIDLPVRPKGYHLVNVTQRFREGSRVSWRHKLKEIPHPRYFVGTDEEYAIFVRKYGQIDRWLPNEAMSCAFMVNNCEALWCNQSFMLALACAMDKRRYVEFKPGKTNCRFYTQNEIAL